MKKLLLSLFIGFVGIISFCNAGSFSIEGNIKDGFNAQMPIPQRYFSKDFSVRCEFDRSNLANCGGYVFKFNFYFAQIYSNTYVYSTLVNTNTTFYVYCGDTTPAVLEYDFSTYTPPAGPNQNYKGVSFLQFNSIFNAEVDVPYSCTFVGDNILNAGSSSCPTCPTCPTCDPQYTSEQCQSVYGLVSSGLLNTCENNYTNCQSDLNSCQSNTSGFNDQLNNCNLSLNACNSSLTNCLQYNCPEIDYTGDLQYSNLYINDILHPGKQNIFVNIPDYITWDYNFTGDDFNLDVGSGYDVDYINSVIDINSYRPTSEDFTNVFVSGLTLVMPYIVIALFIIFVRKLIRRIFK